MKNFLTTWTQALGLAVAPALSCLQAITLFICLLILPFSQTARAQSYVFSKFEVSGNQRIEGSTILSYAGLTRDETISAGALNTAYRNILASGLFERVDMEPMGATLKIAVVELPTPARSVGRNSITAPLARFAELTWRAAAYPCVTVGTTS